MGRIFSRRGLPAEHHAVLHMMSLWVKPCGLHGNKLVLKVLQHLAAVACERTVKDGGDIPICTGIQPHGDTEFL